MMTDLSLITPADILQAADHRLRNWTPEQRSAIADALATIQGDELLDVLPVDGRDPWSAYCALRLLSAHAVGDMEAFYRYGYTVLMSHRQAQRASGPRQGDALDNLIQTYLDEVPDITPKDLWGDFRQHAEEGFHPVLADFDAYTGALAFVPHPNAETEYIRFEAFRRRVQRNRQRKITLPLRP